MFTNNSEDLYKQFVSASEVKKPTGNMGLLSPMKQSSNMDRDEIKDKPAYIAITYFNALRKKRMENK